MNQFDNYKILDNKELQKIEGGITTSVALGLFALGYNIGKDLANTEM